MHNYKIRNFSKPLWRACEIHGLTSHNELAKFTGLSSYQVKRYLEGEGFPSWPALCHIIDKFELPLEFWFNGGKF